MTRIQGGLMVKTECAMCGAPLIRTANQMSRVKFAACSGHCRSEYLWVLKRRQEGVGTGLEKRTGPAIVTVVLTEQERAVLEALGGDAGTGARRAAVLVGRLFGTTEAIRQAAGRCPRGLERGAKRGAARLWTNPETGQVPLFGNVVMGDGGTDGSGHEA